MALLEARPFRPFKSSEEYLYAMKEDLAEWLNALYPGLDLSADNFLDRLDTGVLLCKHANAVRQSALDFVARREARGRPVSIAGGPSPSSAGGIAAPTGASLAMALSVLGDVRFLAAARPGTFFARDNVSNFILWCRRGLGVLECLLFETEDLIARKNEKHVILCLLEVARRGAKLGMLAPMLVHLEREIDREIALESNGNEIDEDSEDEPGFIGPMPQVITNDLKSLDEMVRELVERCQCPTQFPMIRVSEGKYRIGDTKVLIFVRILRSHVMVRVGGGWDTLAHYLDKHDPCRCRSGHRTTICAKLVLKNQGCIDMNTAQVHYERSPPRTRRSSASSVSSSGGGAIGAGSVGMGTATISAGGMAPSPTPQRRIPRASLGASTASSRARSRSPNVDSTSITTGLTASHQRGRRRSRSPGLTPNHRGSPSPSPGRAAPSQPAESVLLPVDSADFPRAVRLRRSSATSDAPVDRTPAIAFLVPPPSSPTPQPAATTATTHAGGDSGSDVGSDEGYRSLGVVTTPPSSADRTNVDTATDGDPASRRTSSDLSEEEEGIVTTEPDDNSSPQQAATPPVKTEVPVPEPVPAPVPISVPISVPVTPRRASSVEPEHICEEDVGAYSKPAAPGRRRSVGSEDMTAYLAASGRRPGPHGVQGPPGHGMPAPGQGAPRREIQHQRLPQLRASESPCRNGRSRSASVEGQRCGGGSPVPSRRRPVPQSTGIRHSHSNSGSGIGGLGADPFLRGSPGRCSLPSRGRPASSTTASGAVPAWPSKQKTISPILEQILQGSDLQDDAKVLQKMKDIIQHYAAIVDEKLAREEKQAQLDFTSAWVHGLPSSPPPSQVGGQTPPTRFTPRKDSQPHVSTSRIPAPVVHGKNRV